MTDSKNIKYIAYNPKGKRRLCKSQKECALFLDIVPSRVCESLKGIRRYTKGCIILPYTKNKLERAILDLYANNKEEWAVKSTGHYRCFYEGINFVLSALAMQSNIYAKDAFVEALNGEYDKKYK